MPALTPANDAIRAVNVTASEVGALLGPHPYTSPQRIYDRLIGSPEYVKPEHTEAMRLGVHFEREIARYTAQKYNLRLRANSRTIAHRSYLLAATPDYLVLRHAGYRLRALVECKLSGIMYGWGEEKMPPHVEWQARAQMLVTDRDVCFVSVLVGSSFYCIPVVREEGKDRQLIAAVSEMETRLMLRQRPPTLEIPQLRKVTVEG